MARDPLKARTVRARHPLDTNQRAGQHLNPPRVQPFGGVTGLHPGGGIKKNSLTIRKPGGTR